ncbi:MAG: hypothetical protein N3E37_03185 [Candidatus Micrarchaeota archaeon]|nr:hypothetical protein [Candidatus Micrarchaeota archaeon]
MDLISIIFSTPMEHYFLRLVISFLGVGILTYYDIKNNKNVPAIICYAFLAVAILFNLIGFMTNNISLNSVIQGVFIAIILGLFLLFFYFAGQIGGADVFAIVAIALLLSGSAEPILNMKPTQFSIVKIPFVFTIILYSFLLFVIYMLIKFVPLMIKRLQEKKVQINKGKIVLASAYILIYSAVLIALSSLPAALNVITLIAFTIAGLASVFYTLFRDEIESTLVTELPLSKIVEEDVLAIQYMDQELVKKYKLQKLLRANELNKLKEISQKEGISKFPIYTGYPAFMPFILVGLILSVMFGNIFV